MGKWKIEVTKLSRDTNIPLISFYSLDDSTKIRQFSIVKHDVRSIVHIYANDPKDGTKMAKRAKEINIKALPFYAFHQYEIFNREIEDIQFDLTGDPIDLEKIVQLIQEYSPLDEHTLFELRKHCNLQVPEVEILEQLKSMEKSPEKVIKILSDGTLSQSHNLTISQSQYPNLHYKLAEYFEKKNELQIAFDIYAMIEEKNPNFTKAVDKIYHMCIEIQADPLTSEEEVDRTDKILLPLLLKARLYDNQFQLLVDKLFHKLSGGVGLDTTHTQVGSGDFIYKMAKELKRQNELELKFKELNAKYAELESKYNALKDDSLSDSKKHGFFK